MHNCRLLLLALSLFPFVFPHGALALTADDINTAVFATPAGSEGHGKAKDTEKGERPKLSSGKSLDPRIVKAQVLLDRRRISPGVIDGYDGENFRKALAELRRQSGLPADDKLDQAAWDALRGDETTDIVTEYEVTRKDADYDFVDTPKDYAELAKMKTIGYRNAAEMIGERFHMDDDLVRALNPGIDSFDAGTRLIVANVGDREAENGGKVTKIVVSKPDGEVTALDKDGRVVAAYPATIGSEHTPTPAGTYKVTRIARNPTYSYDPDKNFKQGDNDEPLTLPPGPNNPVGTVWMALSKPTYGIHGTPEPSKVSKTASHGCVRLTNWDAEDLAKMTEPGATVEFVE